MNLEIVEDSEKQEMLISSKFLLAWNHLNALSMWTVRAHRPVVAQSYQPIACPAE